MRVCAVLAVSSLLGMSFMATPAGAELLYASMGSGSDSRVVTYDISLSSSSAVQASLQTFTGGTTRVNTPGGIAFSPTGDTMYVTNLAGSQTDISVFTSGTYTGKYWQNGVMVQPTGIDTVPNGDIWYTGFGMADVGWLASSGSALGSFPSAALSQPAGLAAYAADASAGRGGTFLYVANFGGNNVLKFDGFGILQQTIPTNQPYGIALDASQNIYVSNYSQNTISKFGPSGNLLATIGGTSSLSGPALIDFDSSGNLYAANSTNNTIAKFDSAGNYQFSWSTPYAPLGVGVYVAAVPEPATYAMALTGIACGGYSMWRRRKRARRA